MTACRAAPSPRARWTSCSRPRRSPPRWSSANARKPLRRPRRNRPRRRSVPDLLPEIVDLLRKKTVHDFTLYKRARSSAASNGAWRWRRSRAAESYLGFLRRDATELDQLSRDLLINVTGFFRDPSVFDFLAASVIPDLVRDHASDRPLRIWVAGCSSGEETYSLAMLLREQIDASNREIKLQIFASDVDADAVASAREGLYPQSIEADVSPERLAHFFTREDRCLSGLARVARKRRVHGAGRPGRPALRASRLRFLPKSADLSSARGAGQSHLDLPFRAARRRPSAGRQRRDGRCGRRPVRHRFQTGAPLSAHGRQPSGRIRAVAERRRTRSAMRARPDTAPAPSRQAVFAELCRSIVLEAYGPAAVLINSKLECLHFQGPTDRYLKVASGPPVAGPDRHGARGRRRRS